MKQHLVTDGGRAFIRQPQAINENDIESLRKVADMLKQQGTKAILQLHHGGKLAIREVNNSDKVAPSSDLQAESRELSSKEI